MKNIFSLIVVALSLAASAFPGFAREDTRLDDGWHFKNGEAEGAENNNFDDHDWQTLAIPHSWG